jgi:hypothetical protein
MDLGSIDVTALVVTQEQGIQSSGGSTQPEAMTHG